MTTLKELLGESYKDGMSLEDVEKALGGIELPKQNDDPVDRSAIEAEIKDKYKALISKSNSEAAKYKKELQAKLSEQEVEKLERDTQFEEMQNEIKELKKEKALASNMSKFTTKLGYNDEQASQASQAFMDGDIDKFVSIASSFQAGQVDAIKSELMKKTPRPEDSGVGGTPKEAMTKEQLYKMSTKDRMKFYQEHPEEYKALHETK